MQQADRPADRRPADGQQYCILRPGVCSPAHAGPSCYIAPSRPGVCTAGPVTRPGGACTRTRYWRTPAEGYRRFSSPGHAARVLVHCWIPLAGNRASPAVPPCRSPPTRGGMVTVSPAGLSAYPSSPLVYVFHHPPDPSPPTPDWAATRPVPKVGSPVQQSGTGAHRQVTSRPVPHPPRPPGSAPIPTESGGGVLKVARLGGEES